MIVDANLLLYSVDRLSPFHTRARDWLYDQLGGTARVGLPWQSLAGFVRVATHPTASPHPQRPDEAWRFVQDWLAFDTAWIPVPTRHHGDIVGDLVTRYHLRGNLIPDADLAALALEHGVALASADTDFARFTELRWINPLADNARRPGRR